MYVVMSYSNPVVVADSVNAAKRWTDTHKPSKVPSIWKQVGDYHQRFAVCAGDRTVFTGVEIRAVDSCIQSL